MRGPVFVLEDLALVISAELLFLYLNRYSTSYLIWTEWCCFVLWLRQNGSKKRLSAFI